MALQVIDTNWLCILVLKCRKMISDGITDEAFVLEDYSKWKDIDLQTKRGIEYYNLLTSVANQLGHVRTVTDLLYRSAWKVK